MGTPAMGPGQPQDSQQPLPAAAGGNGSPAPDQASQPQQPGSTSAPANDMQMLLARWFQAAKEMATADPRLASGANKVAAGIQEMQTALITPPQPTPMAQQPGY